MNDSSQANALAQFRMRLEERVHSSRQEPNWRPADITAEMQQFQGRKLRFDQVAPQLVTEVVRPRLAQLALLFKNASVGDDPSNDRASCWFGYCERFPSSAKIEFAIFPDAPMENLVVRLEASIFPSYQRFEPHDKLLVSLVKPDEAQVVQWVEDRLLEFLEAYLRIDRGIEELEDEVVTDPVCGMRLGRAKAVATADFRGHQYFFCSAACQQQFLHDPAMFIVFRGQ